MFGFNIYEHSYKFLSLASNFTLESSINRRRQRSFSGCECENELCVVNCKACRDVINPSSHLPAAFCGIVPMFRISYRHMSTAAAP
jgi:hypothetical protein